jgi:hypothetical protein
MKKRTIPFLFVLLNVALLSGQNITQGELLGRPTATSITVQAFFDENVEVSIQYGTVSGVYTGQTNWQLFLVNDPAEIIVSGLEANTKYYYRMLYRLPNAPTYITRPEHTFQTQRSLGSTYKYVVQADPHMDEQSNVPLYELCLQNQLDDAPDFMIDLGDFIMTDKLKNLTTNLVPHDTIPYRCKLLRTKYELLGHSVPLFIALGNHEGEAGWNLNNTPDNIALWNTEERKKYFLNPAPDGIFYTGDTTVHNYVGLRENYYSWQWGDALYIVLDPYWYTSPKPTATTGWRWTLGQAQYNWLKNVLTTSTATYKFVFSHQIVGGDPDGRGGVEFADLYEWGGNNLDGTSGFATNRPGWEMPIKDLLTQNHVNIFFHGHDHFFGKQEKDCLIYQETPQPSHPNFNNAAYATTYGYLEGQILPNSGHIRVTVSSTGVLVEYVRAYLPANENATRHNKDVSASYFIDAVSNCYTLGTNNPTMIWNSNYADEIVYPNPFSKETKIEFEVLNSERIHIAIYNVNGQLIKDILNGDYLSNGKFQVMWDGTDNSGNAVADGVYVYKIFKEKGASQAGKIILKR